MKDFSIFEKKIGVTFKNKDLLKQAFIHRSYINEHKNLKMEHNERLEFLGDAVLELVITDHLYRKYPHKPEGELTSYRAALVNTNTLAQLSVKLVMNDFVLLSKGESKDTGRARQYILANVVEALIGAIYLDQGYTVAESFISKYFFPLTDEIVEKGLWQDSKSSFQEMAQERAGITPSYRTLKEKGPDHNKYFEVGVYLDEAHIGTGEGKSKQEAEQDAAKNALEIKGWE